MQAEVGAEESGGDDGEGFCRSGVEVFEAVDDSARDEDGVAGAAFPCLAIDGVGEYAFEAVAGLFVGVVAVGCGTLAPGATSNSNMAMEPPEAWGVTR